MATSRRQIKSLTDLNAKQILVKKDSNDNIIFEVSGALGAGSVTVNVPLTASAIIVTGSSGLIVTNGGISGSTTLQAGGDLTVGGNARIVGGLDVEGNMVVRGTPTIINSDVLEIKDNIVIINKVSGTISPASAYQTVSGGLAVYRGGGEEASVMWVSASNDWQLTYTVAGTASSADLGIKKLKAVTLSGSSGLGVSSQLSVGAPLFIQTTASFANLGSLATSSVTVEGQSITAVNVNQALHAIDTAIGSIGTSESTLNAYKRLRYQATGSLVNGSAVVNLPTASLSAAAFPTASFNYINLDVRILEDGKWVNDLVSVELVITGAANDSLAVLIDAAAAPTATYRILAVNEDVTKYVAV